MEGGERIRGEKRFASFESGGGERMSGVGENLEMRRELMEGDICIGSE